MMKFDRVGLDQNFAKFNRVGPKDISFRKFNFFFYKKWILDFEVNSNI